MQNLAGGRARHIFLLDENDFLGPLVTGHLLPAAILDHCLGNRTHASKILGISIRTLRNKLNQYKDDGEDIPKAG